MYGVGRGVKNARPRRINPYLRLTRYSPDKEYAQLLTNSFNQHNLFKTPFTVRHSNRYIAPNQDIGLTLVNNSREAKLKGHWQLKQYCRL